MYRAKIEGVSGGKVYADGKWLSCIGNKNFRTGEFVWTDGRCAYGHFQESQQPQVIIAPDDEGIPIYTASSRQHQLHSFQKNKLKQVDKRDKPDDFSSLDWSNMKLINDKRRVFTHNYLASNIDSYGNIFVMAEIYKLDDEKTHYAEYKIGIFKDDKTKPELTFNKVHEIDLLDFFDQNFVSNCEKPAIPFANCLFNGSGGVTVGEAFPLGSTGDFTIRRAFIEDDNNFEILLYGGFGYFSQEGGDLLIVHSDYEAYFLIKSNGSELIRSISSYGERNGFYYKQEENLGPTDPPGNYVGWGYYPVYENGEWIDLAYNTTESESNNQIKCSVGDGYYCTMNWERYPPYVQDKVKAYGGEFRFHFFSPDNTEIADIHADSRFDILFRKVKGNYLISLKHFALAIYNLFGVKIEDEIIEGKYIYSAATKELKTLDDSNCSNDRLRPIKKIKGWQKRIKEIDLKLDEVQDKN